MKKRISINPPLLHYLLLHLICISLYRWEPLPLCRCQEVCFGATAEKWDSVCYTIPSASVSINKPEMTEVSVPAEATEIEEEMQHLHRQILKS